jgi:hypothetical protein
MSILDKIDNAIMSDKVIMMDHLNAAGTEKDIHNAILLMLDKSGMTPQLLKTCINDCKKVLEICNRPPIFSADNILYLQDKHHEVLDKLTEKYKCNTINLKLKSIVKFLKCIENDLGYNSGLSMTCLWYSLQ